MPIRRPRHHRIRRTRNAQCAALALLSLAILTACTAPGDPPRIDAAPARVTPWPTPAPAGSAQPDLVRAADGRLWLSWLERPAAGPQRLRLARAAGDALQPAWQAPVTAGTGDDWFVNWADTPHVYALADGSLWAHWLRKTGPEPMDYGIALVRSQDGGRSWTSPAWIHPVDRPGDHGFVSFWPAARDRLGVAWLDSRQKTPGTGHDRHEDHGTGAMMLRAAVYDGALENHGEWALDVATCDCCTTASAMTDAGVVVVYRGRGAGEIRDTRIVRFDGRRWTAPRDVHSDGWKMPGCPVNGPVVVARGRTVWVAWYTMADGVPEVRAARSDDAGDHFGPALSLDKGAHVLGRLGLALAPDMLLLASYRSGRDGAQTLSLARHDLQWRLRDRIDVARLSARGRGSGIPRVQWSGRAAWLAWTDLRDGQTRVMGASVY